VHGAGANNLNILVKAVLFNFAGCAPLESSSYLFMAPPRGYFKTARFGRRREKSEISEKILPCRPLEFPLHSATQVDWPLRKLQHISNQLAINQIHSLYTTIRFSCSGDCTRRHCLKSDSTNLAIEGEAVDRAAQKMPYMMSAT